MKILQPQLLQAYTYNNNNRKSALCSAKSKENYYKELSNAYYFPINFKGEDVKYRNAKKYLDEEIAKNGIPNSLKELDLKKIDGIQSGIKIFEGMNAKEVAFICDNLAEIAIYRGCSGYCGHCYVSAKAPIREDGEHIHRMSFEDYKDLTDGFKTLRERLGFSVGSSITDDISLFRDADCMELELVDKSGKKYDFIELADMAYDAFGKQLLFDTHGWSKSNKKMQQRAERFVEYYSRPENSEKLSQINISINPFSWLNMKSIDALKKNDIEKYKLNRDAYTSRMANVLYTFTPLLKDKKFDVIVRTFPDILDEDFTQGLKESDMTDLSYEILTKLANLYAQDLQGGKKVIKSEEELSDYLDRYIVLMITDVETDLTMSGRLEKLIPKNHPNYYNLKSQMYETIVDDYIYDLDERLFFDENFSKIVDANGRVYLASAAAVIPTELSLNISNKAKKTAEFYNSKKYPPLPRKLINSAEDYQR